MSVWEHSRFKVFNPGQHPYHHSLNEFQYGNPRLSGITNAEDAMNYIISVLYPNYIGTFATPAALPAGTANDYAVVTDDGDGKSAGYVYATIDGVSQWIKRYDVDWSLEGIFAETIDRTQYMYVHKYGMDDRDPADPENPLTGIYAGQTIYGGSSTLTNLTLNANSFDATGYVQTDNTFRPTSDSLLDIGTTLLRFANVFTDSLTSGTMVVTSGSITDSSGAIDFGDEDLSTTGEVAANTLDVSLSAAIDTLVLMSGSITDSTGVIDFDDEDLLTTGVVTAGSGSSFGTLTLADGSITDTTGAIDFDNENLSTTGTLDAGLTTVSRLDVDDLRLDGNTLLVVTTDTDLNLTANGLGVISLNSPTESGNITTIGTVGVTGLITIDNLSLDGNTIATTNANGNLVLDPNGSGLVELTSGLFPTTDSAEDIGKTGNVWNKLWIDGSIGDGTNEITLSDLLALRDTPYRDLARTIPAVAGDTLFWDSVNSVWLASHPDTEITHSELTGLTTGDAGHTQFVLLTGRAGGQSVQGGTAASENLVLESTAHATKGDVLTKDDLIPFTNATFTVSWNGTDLGDNTHFFRDVYTKGEHRGFRFENFTSGTLPASAATATGRMVFATDNDKIYVDNGASFIVASASRFISDTAWNGTDVTKDVDVSSTITDARNALWQLRDNSDDFEIMFVTIKATSASNVRIEVTPALPAGSYRLIGIE